MKIQNTLTEKVSNLLTKQSINILHRFPSETEDILLNLFESFENWSFVSFRNPWQILVRPRKISRDLNESECYIVYMYLSRAIAEQKNLDGFVVLRIYS